MVAASNPDLRGCAVGSKSYLGRWVDFHFRTRFIGAAPNIHLAFSLAFSDARTTNGLTHGFPLNGGYQPMEDTVLMWVEAQL